jgi:hypothetical protein
MSVWTGFFWLRIGTGGGERKAVPLHTMKAFLEGGEV